MSEKLYHDDNVIRVSTSTILVLDRSDEKTCFFVSNLNQHNMLSIKNIICIKYIYN